MKASASSTSSVQSRYSHMLHPAGFQLCNKDIERLEKYQRLCLRVMLPNLADSDTRDAVSGVEDVNIRLNTLCLRYITKVQSDNEHPLHSYTTTGRTSEHSGRHIKSKSRTSMRSKSLFQRFLQCHFYFYDMCVVLYIIMYSFTAFKTLVVQFFPL